MATFKYGNADLLTEGVDFASNDTFIFGNGLGDSWGAARDTDCTIIFGNGDFDHAGLQFAMRDTIILGNGDNDAAFIQNSRDCTITLGNGNNDTVFSGGLFSRITVGNGNDTIHVGMGNTVTVGKGQDSFVFDQTTAGNIGAVTINHFDPNKDVIVLTQTLVPGQNVLPAHDDANGSAVVTVDNSGDTITLVGVHSSALHASDFQFV